MTLAAGYYAKTLEKQLIDTMALSLEGETTVRVQLLTNAYTPDFDVHDFRDDGFVANDPGTSGTYTAAGDLLTTTELTLASPAATQMKYSAANPGPWTGTTITARGTGIYFVVGSAATDAIIAVNTFSGDVTTAGGTFTVTWAANGLFYFDVA